MNIDDQPIETLTNTANAKWSRVADFASWSAESGGGIEKLSWLQALRAAVDLAEGATVLLARAEGASWAEIGQQLGTTRQGAQFRHGWRENPPKTHQQGNDGGHDQEQNADWDVAPPIV